MMRLAATIGCVWAAVLIGATAQSPARPDASAGPTSDVAVVVVEPADGATVVGQAVVTVASKPDGRLAQVTIYVDGREQCVLEQAPWSCRWDAGRDVREHHVRVVAISTDGRRLVANRHTRGLDVSETVNVAAVQVPVVVTGPDGRFVRGLTRQAFTVIEDGQRQTVDTIIDESLPLELIVAADISGSMEGAMPHVQEAIKRLLAKLRPDDTTTLVGFNDTIFVLAERESEPALREAAVDGLVPWGGTAFYDATVQAIDLVGEQAGRRGIVLFSDGEDRHSVGRRDESLRRIEEGQVVLYTIGFGEHTSEGFRKTLAEFAEASGGRAFFPGRAHDLDRTFDAILDELSHQYILSYVSTATAPGTWRRLEIRAACEGCRVRAREGYRAADR
jgi:VWFA-related protein